MSYDYVTSLDIIHLAKLDLLFNDDIIQLYTVSLIILSRDPSMEIITIILRRVFLFFSYIASFSLLFLNLFFLLENRKATLTFVKN